MGVLLQAFYWDFPRDYRCFHPNCFERWDGQAWGEMPDLCMRSPYVYEQLMEHARTLICDLGYDGFRFDFVKGYGSWMVKAIQERIYRRGDAEIRPFGVAEAWASREGPRASPPWCAPTRPAPGATSSCATWRMTSTSWSARAPRISRASSSCSTTA